MPSDAVLAETVNLRADGGDLIPAYLARPMGDGPYPGVVVIHHMPGYDASTKEITRTFAVLGYTAICPNLHHREAPGASPTDASRAVRDAGGVPDARCIADVDAASRYLRDLPSANGKVGVIGYCSGGRQAYLVACSLPFDAAVDCYGGGVVAAPEQLTERTPVAPIDLTANLSCPLLGLFGAEDKRPSPEDVAAIEAELTRRAKTFEIHAYPDAGHAFFSVDRPLYRVEAALDGWQRIRDFFGRYLSP
jgi:carboxymethylenebutenolidase